MSQHQSHTTTQPNQLGEFFHSVAPAIFSPPGLILVCCLGYFIYNSLIGNNSKNKKVLARASLGGAKERAKARSLACQQIEQQVHNKISLYLSTPKGTCTEVVNGKKVVHIPEDPNSIYITNVQSGVFLVGATDTGKSFFGINPLTRSGIDQGIPIIWYDYKGHEDPPPSGELAAYAEENGYKIYIVSPGDPDSCVCNLVDLLENPWDAERAREIAATLNRNLKLSNTDSSNGGYFGESGDQLAQAVLMLAKSAGAEGDVMLCQKILSLDRMVERIKAAPLNPWVRAAFDQFFSTAETPETAASIASTASLLFTRFMVPSALATFCGKTNMPFKLDGKQMVIFRMNPRNRTTVGPLMAAIMQMLLVENVFRQRTKGLLFFGDEISSVYLPILMELLNQVRSSGLGIVLATQMFSLLEKTYGEKEANGIFGGCATQITFQLNDLDTCKKISEMCGEEQVEYKQRSHSRGKEGSSNSTSDQIQTRPLVEVSQLQKLLPGQIILINRGYTDDKEVRIPMLLQLRLPKRDIDTVNRCKLGWSEIRRKLIKRSTARIPEKETLERREKKARLMLQLPEEREQVDELLHELATIY